MALPKVLKNFTCFVNGFGYAGKVDEIELPKITLQTEDHRAGGMDTPAQLDMGTEALEATITFAEYDPKLFPMFGLVDGAWVGLVFRGAQQSGDGEAEPVMVVLRGALKELDMGSWKSGEKNQFKVSVSAMYYLLTVNDIPMVEIDVENMRRVIGGVDQLASQRRAMGV